MSDIATRRHDGHHFVVTGAGTGIGRAIALRLATEGATLSLLARDADRLAVVADLATDAGARGVHVAACDVRDKALVERCVTAAVDAHGPVHGLVANSGIGGPNAPGDDDRFEALIATNVLGTYHCLRAAQRHLAQGPEARHFVVIASVLARIGVAGHTGYCASKAALLGLVRALAVELAPRNVQVNAVCPGWTNTDMARDGIEGIARALSTTYEQAFATAMQAVPLGRMSEPRDVAGTVAWLLSPDARGVTGQGIDINGGSYMG